MGTVIKYVGRTTDFRGKTLWEIVGNLKNFGVGRIVTRSMFERYQEPCFMKIVKVEALPNEEVRKVKVTVEKTFRGITYPNLIEINSVSYKADYRLIPKAEEAEYCSIKQKREEKILPSMIELPPLLKQFIVEETGNPNPLMPLKIKSTRQKHYHIAKESEKPSAQVTIANTLSSKIYDDVKHVN